jgi:hypothetical protein
MPGGSAPAPLLGRDQPSPPGAALPNGGQTFEGAVAASEIGEGLAGGRAVLGQHLGVGPARGREGKVRGCAGCW